jgi:alpha-mannosidase
VPGPDSTALVAGDGWEMRVSAESDLTEAFSVLHVTIDNRRPDHRLRVLLRLPHDAEGSRAGAPFEIVERPVCGEGGPDEIASPWWPARGFVTAGGSGFLSEGVMEYEVIPPRTLAVTLMRCTSTISRPHALSTRRGPAGPDIATPGAQLIGSTKLTLGILRDTHGASIVQVWEQFALPLLASDTPGSGGGPRGLLDVAVPALSSVRKSVGGVEVRMFNPVDSEQPYRVGSMAGTIRPFRIETVLLGGRG